MKQYFKARGEGPQGAAALTAQMSSRKYLANQAAVWISHLAHARSCVTL